MNSFFYPHLFFTKGQKSRQKESEELDSGKQGIGYLMLLVNNNISVIQS